MKRHIEPVTPDAPDDAAGTSPGEGTTDPPLEVSYGFRGQLIARIEFLEKYLREYLDSTNCEPGRDPDPNGNLAHAFAKLWKRMGQFETRRLLRSKKNPDE